MRIAVVLHQMGPYHFARMREAGRRMDVTAIEMPGMDSTYLWDEISGADGFHRITITQSSDLERTAGTDLVRQIYAALDAANPQVVAIPGWGDAGALGAMHWCVARKIPAVLMSETTAWDEPRRWWKEKLKGRLVRNCRAGFVGGQAHKQYLARLGMPADRIFLGYDAVDVEYFMSTAEELRVRRPEIRQERRLSNRYFLASARFVEKKNLDRLIRAYSIYRGMHRLSSKQASEDNAWPLVLLGDGPLKPQIRRLVTELQLDAFVHMPGFKQYDELPAYYAAAGAFIHASTTEQWGLVVNEAMASGLPIIVSQRCGCANELVREGRNGYTFDPYNVHEAAALMHRLADCDEDARIEMGVASRDIINRWSPKAFSEGMYNAAMTALEDPVTVRRSGDLFYLNCVLQRLKAAPPARYV